MRRVTVLACFVVASAAVALGGGAPADACSCGPQSDEKNLADATAVFTGDVTGHRTIGDVAVWMFAVRHVFKGDVPSEVHVMSSSNGGTCGLEIPTFGTALVFARTPPDGAPRADDIALAAGLCDGTRSLDAAPVPASFGAGTAPRAAAGAHIPQPPAPEEGEPSPRIALLAGAIAAASSVAGLAAVAIALRRARRP